MNMIPVKRTIALAVVSVFCFISVYGFITNKASLNDIMPTVCLVVGYYFGNGKKDGGTDGK